MYDVRWQRGKRFSQQDYWKIYRNGEAIGEAKTLLTLKNSAKLKESLQFHFSVMELTTSAITINASISLTQEGVELGSLKRKNPISGVQVLNVVDDRPEYLLALIVHSFYV